MQMKRSARRGKRGAAWWNRAADGVSSLGGHELAALSGHWAEVRERLAVARKARGLGELVRDQFDLLPETRMRLALDQRERTRLLRDVLARLRAA
jgi:hypothetical protein